MPKPARILTIAGSDSGGGAGIQADLKTIGALGGYGMSAITALTAQNTIDVAAIELVHPDMVAKQIEMVLGDIGADAIKIGMLGSAAITEAVTDALHNVTVPIVLDPVMIAKSGDALLEADALAALKNLAKQATLLTPNIPEAECFLGEDITTAPAMQSAASTLMEQLGTAILLKGGHGEGEMIVNVLAQPGKQPLSLTSKRIDTRHTHGTGCTLSAAIATYLGQGIALEEAVRRAEAYVQQAIAHAPGFGGGHGPLGHCFTFVIPEANFLHECNEWT